jgi:DNA ligase-1
MTRKLQELAVKRDPRRVWVLPRIVVEVIYNEIQRSSKYPCGMALRFARIRRIREDKAPDEANTLQEVYRIYAKQVKRHGIS